MAKKLTEDQIKWILSVESTEAQQGIRALTKANKELEKANKERRSELIRMEIQGKKETVQYKNLSAAVKQNSEQIEKNQSVIKGLEGTLKLSELTMWQLKKRSQDLTRQLDTMSKSLHPEEYNKLEKELGDVKNRMTQLRDESKQTQQSIGKMILSKGSIASFFGNVYTAVANFVVNGVKKIGEFIAEGTRMAGMAQGIDYAFNRISNRDYLNSLREQTKGLISDLTLMKSAVRAENFNIPLGQLGKLLEFAQNRARDTGESVDYLVESIINGIGRKSPLILDNLGISAVRLQEEVKKTGDFAAAVGEIVEEEMVKAGPAIDTAADAATRKKVAWENLQLTVGKFFVEFSYGWDNMMAKFAEGLSKILRGNEDAKKSYDDQIKKVADLEVNTGALVKRYEQLKQKASLNKKEQLELTQIMNEISLSLPGVTNEFDRYGNALSINTRKVWAFIAAEKEKLRVMNNDAIVSLKDKYNAAIRDLIILNSKIDTGGTTAYAGSTNYKSQFVPYTQKEMDELKKQQAALKGRIQDFNEQMMYLDGTSTEIQLKNEEERVNSRNRFNAMNKSQLAAWLADERNATDKFREIAQETYNIRFGDSSGGNENSSTKTGPGKDQTPQWKKDLEALDLTLEQERLKLKESRANELITETEYKMKLEQLELDFLFKKIDIANLDLQTQMSIQDKIFEYKIKMLEQLKVIENNYFTEQQKMIDKQNKEREKLNESLGNRIAKTSQQQLKDDLEKRIAANKQMVELTTAFSNEIGSLVGGAMAGNKDIVKDSIVSLINTGLDYLNIQAQMAIAGATLSSLAQPDSVATFGASGFARALLMTGLINAAFQAAKVVVGSIASKIGGGSSGSSGGSGSGGTTRVLSGKETGGFLDVNRAQDGRSFRATYAPTRRGYVDRPTVIVGEGAGSREWIAPNDALKNPTIAPFIELLEQSRMRGDIRTIDLNQIMRTRMAGFASGGYLNDNPIADAMRSSSADPALFLRKDGTVSQADKSIIELNKILKKLDSNGISVNYHQWDKAQKKMESIKFKAARK